MVVESRGEMEKTINIIIEKEGESCLVIYLNKKQTNKRSKDTNDDINTFGNISINFL